METTSNNTEKKEISIEEFRKIFDEMRNNKIERKGFIAIPNLTGFDFYEVEEDVLKQLLKMEGFVRRYLKENRIEDYELPKIEIEEFKLHPYWRYL